MDRKTKAYALQYISAYQSYKGHWCYEDGCALKAAADLYHATEDIRYRDFVLRWLSERVGKDGSISGYESTIYSIDTINNGKALFFAWDETEDGRYRKAIEYHIKRLMEHPRCLCGNFWHKEMYPYQVWLDGLYMAQPFYMEYESRFDRMEHVSDITKQFANVRKELWNDEKGLYCHAWDESRTQPWCDVKTGKSPNFWLRSMGWYLMALIDCIELCDERLYEHKRLLIDIFREAISGIMRWQDHESKLFYQVIDRADVAENYLETSGSAMIAYAILKGVRLGVLLKDRWLDKGKAIFDSLENKKLILQEDGQLHLKDICAVAGLGPDNKRDGSVAYYLSEPVVDDDVKGVAPFLMAYAERLMSERDHI